MPFQACSVGMVVGPHPRTAEAGLEVLRAGGNAFDAAVAAAFTEAVVQPAHNGVAGYGGGMVGFLADPGQVVCVDFNTEAPAAATPEMFPLEAVAPPQPPNSGGSPISLYRIRDSLNSLGALSIGIPGIVGGLDEIHRSWGTRPIAELLGPAIRAARDGWECNAHTAKNLGEKAEMIRHRFPETARLLMPEGREPKPGDRMSNPELADLLERLTSVGLRDFYEGETATRVVGYLQEQGGILTREDMAGYRARHVPPTQSEYRRHTLLTPPPGCGGVTTLQMLQVLEGFEVPEPANAAFYHLFAEVMKACWRRRLMEVGDPAFTGMSETAQLEEGRIAELRAEVEAGLRGEVEREPIAPEPFTCTSHINVVDASGNAVALTQTHGASFGSCVTVPGTGLTFGHGMGRFEPRSGWPNSIGPGKRPLHNMAPMLALRSGRPAAVYGTPGGRTIVNNQAYFSLCIYRFGLDIATALALPRLHCEEAEPMKLEEAAGHEVFEALRALGHRIVAVDKSGGPAHGIVIGDSPRHLDGATDTRWNGKVAFG
jgi:gamma-glutamyltranspeptidase / glutathione hydrolase